MNFFSFIFKSRMTCSEFSEGRSLGNRFVTTLNSTKLGAPNVHNVNYCNGLCEHTQRERKIRCKKWKTTFHIFLCFIQFILSMAFSKEQITSSVNVIYLIDVQQ